jgi:hypothetical protein
MLQDPIKLIGTTAAGGGATVTSDSAILGRLYAVEWVDGDLANNNTAVLSVVRTDSGVNQAVHTLVASEGDGDGWWYPRVAVHDLSAVGRFYNDESDEPVVDYPIVNGYLQLVIAAGGASKTGGCIVYVMD